MTNYDPFAPSNNQPASPWEPADQNHPVVQAYTASKEMTVMNEAPLTATIKGGGGYDAPWLVVRAATVDEMTNLVNEIQAKGLYNLLSAGVEAFAASKGGSATQPPQAFQRNSQQQSYQQPTQQSGGGDGRTCQHGEMAYKTGTNKFGKPYAAYFCPTPKGTPGQCQAQFV